MIPRTRPGALGGTVTLRWIPTLDPAKKNERGHGLNFYGPTAILSDGAGLAERVFRNWPELFRLGPEQFLLTGAWTQVEGDPGPGQYEVLRFNRDECVTALNRIAENCRRVATSDGAFFVLHIGI